MMRATINTEVNPIVGSEKQSEDLVMYLLKEFEESPARIWESNIFGKSLHELVNEGLHNKLYRMPEDARIKLQETIERIINCRCIIELSQNAFLERMAWLFSLFQARRKCNSVCVDLHFCRFTMGWCIAFLAVFPSGILIIHHPMVKVCKPA